MGNQGGDSAGKGQGDRLLSWRSANRLAAYLISLLCLIGGVLRLQKLRELNQPPDQEVPFFFLAAAVVLVADSITRFKFGDMEFEREVESLQGRVKELSDVYIGQQVATVTSTATAPVEHPAMDSPSGRQKPESKSLEEWAQELEERLYLPPLNWNDDPVAKLKAPASVGTSRLTATVHTSSNRPDQFRISVDVTVGPDISIREEPRVVFLLHHTFANPVRLVPLMGRSAHLTLISVGTFTIGALLPDGTQLALDLEQADLSSLSQRERHTFINT